MDGQGAWKLDFGGTVYDHHVIVYRISGISWFEPLAVRRHPRSAFV